jgi:SAM-dependent methyltransferase
VIQQVADYYGRALAAHGPTARGVDWSTEADQELRFEILLDVVSWTPRPTLLDYGCGYGALATYLDAHRLQCDYVGYDIAAPMLAAARRAHPRRVFVEAPDPADYVIASGIFNVKLDTPTAVWEAHVQETIARLAALARRGLAFNLLPPASPPERARDDLYYAEPDVIAEHCGALGDVSVRRDYGLWEYTVTVRR